MTTALSAPVALSASAPPPGFPHALPARLAARRLLTRQSERDRLRRGFDPEHYAGLTDYYFATTAADADPRRVFDALRWGGQFVFVSPHEREAAAVARAFRGRDEFVTDTRLDSFIGPRFDNRFIRLSRTYFTFTARKVLMTRPDEATDRHSYDVRLVPSPDSTSGGDGWAVHKRVPSDEGACARLAARFPEIECDTIRNAAVKLVDKVYPIFLTREAAFLKILQRELPDRFRGRVPAVLDIQKDDRGFVREFRMSWLRLGGDPIDQLAFAQQAAQLLTILHDELNIVHLDLRLDNYVVTPHGVGFVDFGSASRIGEDFSKSSILRSFFDEMLSSSQVQRDLRKLQSRGAVTNRVFDGCYHKIDKAVDLFYLLMEINRPLDNPDFRGLVTHHPRSHDAERLTALAREVYQPSDPHRPRFTCARDVRDELNVM